MKTLAMSSERPLGLSEISYRIWRREGLGGFWRGWLPAYCRLGPHALLQFPLLEQIRILLGLGHF